MEVGIQVRYHVAAGHSTYHVNVIKLKSEIMWTGGLPHLSGVPPPLCKQALRMTLLLLFLNFSAHKPAFC